jgi:hypothetical protein
MIDLTPALSKGEGAAWTLVMTIFDRWPSLLTAIISIIRSASSQLLNV